MMIVIARSASAELIVDYKVVDDDGVGLSGVHVDVTTWKGIKRDAHGWPDDDYYIESDASDHSGNGSIRFPDFSNGIVSISSPTKVDGFYKCNGLKIKVDRDRNGQWPVHVPAVLVYKKIRNPVSMYVAEVDICLPDGAGPWKYDLLERDWLPPNGTGKQADLEFGLRYDVTPQQSTHYSTLVYYDLTLSVEAPGDGTGLMPLPLPVDMSSELRSPALAPEQGFQRKIELRNWVADGDIYQAAAVGGTVVQKSPIFDSDYLLKVNAHDGSGKIIVGKIYGGISNWNYSKKSFRIKYYINPNPSSRSLEWNLTNLFHDRTQNFSDP